MADTFGYHGDGFETGESAEAHVPSLERDGDPFFHTQVAPEPERHGDWQVYNPTKTPVDMDGLENVVDQHDKETTTPPTEEDIIASYEREFGQ